MDSVVTSVLRPGEEIIGKASGRIEAAAFGGALFPSVDIFLATNQRILYFTKLQTKARKGKSNISFEKEIPYDSITKFSIYRDIMHGVGGLLVKSFHLQDNDGELYRMVGPIVDDNFIAYVNSRVPEEARLS